MDWFLRIFPDYRKRIASNSYLIHYQEDAIRALNKSVADCKNSLAWVNSHIELIKKGYEIINIAEQNGHYKVIAVKKDAQFVFKRSSIFVEIHAIVDDRLVYSKENLHAAEHITASTYCTCIEIIEVSATPNSGNGGLLLDGLIKYIQRRNEGTVTTISGMLEPIDYTDHPDRLIHFYTKHGFEIFDTKDPNRKRMVLELGTAESPVINDLRAENARLRAELDTAKQ